MPPKSPTIAHLSDAREPEDHQRDKPSANGSGGGSGGRQRGRAAAAAAAAAAKARAEAIEAATINEEKSGPSGPNMQLRKKRRLVPLKGVGITWADESAPAASPMSSAPTSAAAALSLARSAPKAPSLTHVRFFYRELPSSAHGHLSPSQLADALHAVHSGGQIGALSEASQNAQADARQAQQHAEHMRRVSALHSAHRHAHVPLIVCESVGLWRAPSDIAVDSSLLLGRGAQSKEKDVQITRERTVIAQHYLTAKQIPPEPELVPEGEADANDDVDNSSFEIRRIPCDADAATPMTPAPPVSPSPPEVPAPSIDALSTLSAIKGLLGSIIPAPAAVLPSPPKTINSASLNSLLAQFTSHRTTAAAPAPAALPVPAPTTYFPPPAALPLPPPPAPASTTAPIIPAALASYFPSYATAPAAAPTLPSPLNSFPPPPPPPSASSLPTPPLPSIFPAPPPPPPTVTSTLPTPPPGWPAGIPFNPMAAAQTQEQVNRARELAAAAGRKRSASEVDQQTQADAKRPKINESSPPTPLSAPVALPVPPQPQLLQPQPPVQPVYSYMQDVRDTMPSAPGAKPWLKRSFSNTKLCSWFDGPRPCMTGDKCTFAHVLKSNQVPPPTAAAPLPPPVQQFAPPPPPPQQQTYGMQPPVQHQQAPAPYQPQQPPPQQQVYNPHPLPTSNYYPPQQPQAQPQQYAPPPPQQQHAAFPPPQQQQLQQKPAYYPPQFPPPHHQQQQPQQQPQPQQFVANSYAPQQQQQHRPPPPPQQYGHMQPAGVGNAYGNYPQAAPLVNGHQPPQPQQTAWSSSQPVHYSQQAPPQSQQPHQQQQQPVHVVNTFGPPQYR